MTMLDVNYWFAFVLVCALLLFREGAEARDNGKPVARFLRWFHATVTRFLLWVRRRFFS